MLAGRKDKEVGVFNYPLSLRAHNKKSGITLVEVLVAAFILVMIIGALLLVLNVGNFVNTISGAKLEVQQEVRRAMDWIIKDLRQTDRMRLMVTDQFGNPVQFGSGSLADGDIFTDPIFNICIDYNGSSMVWSPNQIGYTFETANQRIIRTDFGTNRTWEFNHISNLTFTKIGLNSLRVTIAGQRTAIGTIAPEFTLQGEVRLRNE